MSGNLVWIDVMFFPQQGKDPCSKRLPLLQEGQAQGKRLLDQLYTHIETKTVAILGWTELAKYRIFQEEQKTNTAPF